jgi:hypothetical protein
MMERIIVKTPLIKLSNVKGETSSIIHTSYVGLESKGKIIKTWGEIKL